MNHFVLTFRKLKKNKMATSLSILSLVVGLVCVLYIFLWIADELGYNRFHKNIDRIITVRSYLEMGNSERQEFDGCPPAVGPAIQSEYPEVFESARYIPPYSMSLLSVGDQYFSEPVAMADQSLFSIFSFDFILGTANFSDPNSVVLTRKTAIKIFGDFHVVGKTVTFNKTRDFTITGVIEDLPMRSSLSFGGVVPLALMTVETNNPNYLKTWYNNSFTTYCLLRDQNDFQKISSAIHHRIQKEMPESKNYLRTSFFKDDYLIEMGHIENVRIFGFVGFLVLLAAIINFINLTTARSAGQARIIGLRKSLGATRGSLIRHIYAEVAIITFLAFVLALLLVVAGMPIFNQYVEKQMDWIGMASATNLVGILLIYFVTVGLAGSYPALFLSGVSPRQAMVLNFKAGRQHRIFRNGLVVILYVVSIILLSSTIVIYQQTKFLQNRNLGYEKEQLMYIGLSGALKNHAFSLKEELGRHPGVESVCMTAGLPFSIGNNGEGWNWEGKDPQFKPLVTNWLTDQNLVATFGATMLEGRYFNDQEQGIVINKTFADMIGWDSFAGKTINGYGTDYTILGVINDVHFNSLRKNTAPMVIGFIEDSYDPYLVLKVDMGNVGPIISHIQKVCHQLEPAYPLRYGFFNERINQLLTNERNTNMLIGVFSVFSILVLCLGLLGIIIFHAEQKTKEIAIRKCLGEPVHRIIQLLIKPFLLSGVVACIVAIPLGWLIMRTWLQSYSLRVELSATTFIVSGLLIIAIAVVTVIWQSWLAANRNPAESLKAD
ncbi:MAG: ABC transporter permease [Breznakibacter sp.]